MECAPTARDVIAHWAAPAESASEVHAGIGVPLSVNVTMRERGPAPPASVTLNVTPRPEIDGWWFDVMGCAPTASAEVVNCAEPFERVSELQPEIGVPLSLNVTVPEGGPAVPVSVAFKVTAWPDVDGLSVDPILSLATAALTVWVKVLD